MAGWTPGPWRYDPKSQYVLAGKSTRITSPFWLGKKKEENEANAHLIAAAPELYDALLTLVPWLEVTQMNQLPGGIAALRALARARGERS